MFGQKKKSYEELHGVEAPKELTFKDGYNAAQNGDLATVKGWVVQNYSNINKADPTTDYTLLHVAAKNGKTTVVQYLLSKGADPNCLSHQNKNDLATKNVTPLHLASGNGHLDVVRSLVEKGAKVNYTSWQWRSAIHYAILSTLKEQEVIKVVEYLLDNGVDLMQEAWWDATGHTRLNLTHFSMVAEKSEICILILNKINDFARLTQKVSQLEATVAQLQTTVQTLIEENKALKASVSQRHSDDFNPRARP